MSRGSHVAHPVLMNHSRPALALGALTLSVSLLAVSAFAQDGGFSPDERRRLLDGELVKRDVTRTEGRSQLFGGTSWQRVHAPIDRVWATVRDVSVYPRLIPSLERVRVVANDGDTRIVHMEHVYSIASSSYYVRMEIDEEQHAIRFALDPSRPHDIQAGRGFVSLSSYRGDTIVAWGMLADVGGGALLQVFGPFLNEWLLLPPRCVRDEVEPGRGPGC